MPTLRTEAVSKEFGGVQALKGVTISLPAGSTLGLIGPNGSGKTTLLNIIAGLEKPTSGAVMLGETRIDHLPANAIVKLGVAKTHQIPRPFAEMTTRENVSVAVMYGRRRIKDTKRSLNEADRLLSLLGMDARRDLPASSLTVQEKKRLELARALATGAEVILLDEVFAGLSPDELRDSIQLFRKIRGEVGFSALIVEHVMGAVLTLAERVVVLEEGAKIAEGTPDEVVHNEAVIRAYLGFEENDSPG